MIVTYVTEDYLMTLYSFGGRKYRTQFYYHSNLFVQWIDDATSCGGWRRIAEFKVGKNAGRIAIS